ncbi:hypothetical protein GCM10010346_40630 [Streptomyces chryseus]|uniref:Uncharacterized protein n=1 Tax=Streptomyces chryseus TaxID=68186 RepID=A0ABQ3DWQ0_9ACTN|nr:hypothetical protein GCM10010346_40630 [Streptomyces chryseus]
MLLGLLEGVGLLVTGVLAGLRVPRLLVRLMRAGLLVRILVRVLRVLLAPGRLLSWPHGP